MTLARRMQQIKPSPTMAMAAQVKALSEKGIDIVDFGIGEPDFRSPDVASEAAHRAIQDGHTKYTPASGTDELKEAIIHKLKADHHLDYNKREVIVSCGAKHTLYNIAQVLFDPQDEVIIPAPYWVSYPDQVLLNDARPVFIETREEDQFLLTPSQLKKAITSRTKAIILNYPCNPTGSTYTAKQLEGLSDLLIETPLWIISDEIYEKFVYDDVVHTSIASLGGPLKKKTILVNGVSKSYAMTGWRIGYAAGNQEVIEAMGTVQSQCTSNPSSISQKAAAAALREGGSFVQTMIREFSDRRDLMVKGLNAIPGIKCPRPLGSFYVFPNVKALIGTTYNGHKIGSSLHLAAFLLEQGWVSTIPGEAFGVAGYLRLSFATSKERLMTGLQKIKEAILMLSHG